MIFTGGDVALKDVRARFMINQTITEAAITIKNDNDLEAIETFDIDIFISPPIRNIGVNSGPFSTALVRIVSDDSKLCRIFSFTYYCCCDTSCICTIFFNDV